VAGRQAVREGPIALTRLGFIEEWLNATEFDPQDYASQEAVAARAKTVRALHGKIFEWQAVRRCAGTPPIWEVAVRVDDTKRIIVFRIAGERATELRMVGIASRTTPGCAAVDISRNLGSVGSELPW
jgi:dTDP-4-dehydrorhamnose 3,5-epimerase-like enzyme